MKIILDACFDTNFGDDLFINTVISRYPNVKFYVFWNFSHPEVLQRAMSFPNMVIMPANCRIADDMPFDGYVMVGGDVFVDGADYSWRLQNMTAVKKHGGFIALQGFNLYENYSEETVKDLQTIMGMADFIVPRDEASAERLLKLIPDVQVTRSSDMAFTGNYVMERTENREILGIAPRRKYMTDEDAYQMYCSDMAAIADNWLGNHPNGTVRFLGLCTGMFDDVQVSHDIVGKMGNSHKCEIIGYNGDLDDFLEKMRNCTAMLPTRFHGLVFALIYKIPFVPVIYEVKLKQLLNELNYDAVRLPYAEPISDSMRKGALEALEAWHVDEQSLSAYYKKADLFFAGLDREISERSKGKPKVPGNNGIFFCNTVESLRYEVNVLRGQYSALTESHSQLEQKYDYLKLERDYIEKERDYKERERDYMKKERDYFKQERDYIEKERDYFKRDGEYLKQERDHLKWVVSEKEKELDALNESNEQVKALYNDLLGKANSFKGLAYLIARKFYNVLKSILRRGKA